MNNLIAASALAVLLLVVDLSSTKSAAQSNVPFIATDDLRNDLRCMGNKEVLSPHLEALAERGRLLTRHSLAQAVRLCR